MKNEPFLILGAQVQPGSNAEILHDFSTLYTKRKLGIPIHIFNGAQAGNTVFIFSALHGNELNGIKILKNLHQHPLLKNLQGTLITIPVVNPFGFILKTREVVKGKDLNRSFPGNSNGGLASRLAHFLTHEIIKKSDYGIDLHSGSEFLFSYPHIRISTKLPESKAIALASGIPVINYKVFPKSLRNLTNDLDIPLMVYEGGEALKLDEGCIDDGMQAILNILAKLKMINLEGQEQPKISPFFDNVHWLRSPSSGILYHKHLASNKIKKGDLLAEILDPFDLQGSVLVKANTDGIIIAKSTSSVTNEGDPLFHIAQPQKFS